MKYVIDRIAGNIAVLEGYDGSHLELEKIKLPKGAKEGSSIKIDESGSVTLFVDAEREERIAAKMKNVWR